MEMVEKERKLEKLRQVGDQVLGPWSFCGASLVSQSLWTLSKHMSNA